jgi:hypothetical protein
MVEMNIRIHDREELGTARTFVAVFMVEKLVQFEKDLVVCVNRLFALSAKVELFAYTAARAVR